MNSKMEAMHAARRNKKEQRIWDAVVAYRKQAGEKCECDLKPGMTWESLFPLGGGCTMPNYCCPVLDKYRREIGYPEPPEVEDE